MATGLIFYGGEGEGHGWHAEMGWEPWWYVCDPRELLQVGQGMQPPYWPTPTYWRATEIGIDAMGNGGGLVFDSTNNENMLYAFIPAPEGPNDAGAVACYQILDAPL